MSRSRDGTGQSFLDPKIYEYIGLFVLEILCVRSLPSVGCYCCFAFKLAGTHGLRKTLAGEAVEEKSFHAWLPGGTTTQSSDSSMENLVHMNILAEETREVGHRTWACFHAVDLKHYGAVFVKLWVRTHLMGHK